MREAVTKLACVPNKGHETAPHPHPCTCFPELKSRACLPASDEPLDLEPGKADSSGTGVAAGK